MSNMFLALSKKEKSTSVDFGYLLFSEQKIVLRRGRNFGHAL
jgi:hypothetical protein